MKKLAILGMLLAVLLSLFGVLFSVESKVIIAVSDEYLFKNTCMTVNNTMQRNINERERIITGVFGFGQNTITIRSAGYVDYEESFFSSGINDNREIKPALTPKDALEDAASIDVGLDPNATTLVGAEYYRDNAWLVSRYVDGDSFPYVFFSEFDDKTCGWNLINYGTNSEIQPGVIPEDLRKKYL